VKRQWRTLLSAIQDEFSKSGNTCEKLYRFTIKSTKIIETEMLFKLGVFWDVLSCSKLDVDGRFRDACCLHHQGPPKYFSCLHGPNRKRHRMYVLAVLSAHDAGGSAGGPALRRRRTTLGGLPVHTQATFPRNHVRNNAVPSQTGRTLTVATGANTPKPNIANRCWTRRSKAGVLSSLLEVT
jgi:hypothetical protein